MPALKTVGWVVGPFVLLGLVAGVLWKLVSRPPYYVRTAQGAVMDQAELAKRIQADGRFLVIGLVVSLLAGLVLVLTRGRRDPLLVVVLGALSATGAGWIALELGRTLGHVDVGAQARAAKVGAHITDSLGVISPLVLLIWPIGYLLAVVTVLWGTSPNQPTSEEKSDTMFVSDSSSS